MHSMRLLTRYVDAHHTQGTLTTIADLARDSEAARAAQVAKASRLPTIRRPSDKLQMMLGGKAPSGGNTPLRSVFKKHTVTSKEPTAEEHAAAKRRTNRLRTIFARAVKKVSICEWRPGACMCRCMCR